MGPGGNYFRTTEKVKLNHKKIKNMKFTCDYCRKSYCEKYVLSRHMKMKHPENKTENNVRVHLKLSPFKKIRIKFFDSRYVCLARTEKW